MRAQLKYTFLLSVCGIYFQVCVFNGPTHSVSHSLPTFWRGGAYVYTIQYMYIVHEDDTIEVNNRNSRVVYCAVTNSET